MQVTIDSVSDVKEGQYGLSSKIMAGGKSYFVNCDATQYTGKLVEMEVEEKTSAKGNKYSIAKNLHAVHTYEVPKSTSNGGISWGEYETMAILAHGMAMRLEPDTKVEHDEQGQYSGGTVIAIDRSTARAAILNTVMIAFSNGKIFLAVAEDDIPF